MITAGGATAGQRPQEGGRQPVFRAGVELVVFNAAVLDDDGAPVTDLGATDFRVRQAGVEQEITLFATPDESPLDVALAPRDSERPSGRRRRIRFWRRASAAWT